MYPDLTYEFVDSFEVLRAANMSPGMSTIKFKMNGKLISYNFY